MTESKIAVVTGAAGFIGSHMVDLLLGNGYKVRGIDNLARGRLENLANCKSNPNLVFEARDLRDMEADDSTFREAEFIFHFAGIPDVVPSIDHPTEYLSANVMSTVHALEGARNAGVRKFVYAASSSCYGLAKETPTTEQAEICPQYPYALSKYMGEEVVMHWGQIYHLPVIAMRIFNAYGPRARTTGAYGSVFGVFLAQKLAGKPFTVVGDGSQSRDFIFVTDIAKAFLEAAVSKQDNEIYNLGGGAPQTINRIVDLLGGDVVNMPKRPGEPDCTWADISKIQSHLKWAPEVSFQDGVATMLNHIESWNDAPLWNPESIQVVTKNWFDMLSEKQRDNDI